MSFPKVSIVIPIYNVENYLKKCLDSVVNQTYTNIEIILIDDGSKDNSGKICDEYALKDYRVVVIHKENQGVAQARNNGIMMAHGEYVMFVDGDDWVDFCICETLIDALFEYKVEASMCAYTREYSDKSLPRLLHSENIVFDGKKFQRRLCGPIGEELRHPEYLDCYSTMCGRLYPLEVIKGKRVTDTNLIGTSEDTLYNIEAFSEIDNIVYINQPLYHYRKNVSTSITSVYKSDLESKWGNLYDKIRLEIEEKKLGEPFYSALSNRIAINILGMGLNCINDNASFFNKLKRIRVATSNKERNKALKQLPLKYMPLHWKAFFFFAKNKLNLPFYILLTIIKKLKGKI